MRRASGFTLVELLIASTISSLVVAAAFLLLSSTQQVAAVQERAVERVARGRLAMALIGRDVRSAGDSLQDLSADCLGAAADPTSEWRCPAILDAHPWRLTIARNAWNPGPDGILHTTDDRPNVGVPFTANRDNVVSFEFRPDGGERAANGRKFYRGQLVRIEDPFEFGGAGSRRETVLVDDVVVDDRMVVDPADPAQHDERHDFAVFGYRILSAGPDEFAGDEAIVKRNTRRTSFLLPTAVFHDVAGTLPTPPKVAPFRPDYGFPKIKGLKGKGKAKANGLRKGSTTESDAEADLAFVLAHNRIRAVRVAFKVVAGREDPARVDGLDLDPAVPGTAPLVPLESLFELKVFSGHLTPRDRS